MTTTGKYKNNKDDGRYMTLIGKFMTKNKKDDGYYIMNTTG